MSETNIPSEIKEKIDAESELRYPVKNHSNPSDSPYVHSQKTFRHGVQYGYSLASKTINEQRERIKELESLLEIERNHSKPTPEGYF